MGGSGAARCGQARAVAHQPEVQLSSFTLQSPSSWNSSRFASITAAKHADGPSASKPAAPPSGASKEKPLLDIVAGAMARAASQSAIHPIDTLKVRMQSGRTPGAAAQQQPGGPSRSFRVHAAGVEVKGFDVRCALAEVRSMYKGVAGAATGAGIIIGAYFAFYSYTKKLLKETTDMHEGTVAFVSGATAAVGSSVVKVPIAVCVRSVQAGVFANVFEAANSIVKSAGWRGIFTGLLPTLLEDAPDMAVKFAAYESMRAVHRKLHNDESPSTLEDLLMGGIAGSAAAAATTPLDVVKTRMMCNAATRPTLVQAVQSVIAEGAGARSFFRGVGPRALSNGLNSAVFFACFEMIRKALLEEQQRRRARATLACVSMCRLAHGQAQASAAAAAAGSALLWCQQACMAASRTPAPAPHGTAAAPAPAAALGAGRAAVLPGPMSNQQRRHSRETGSLACLSLAIPLPASAGLRT